MRVERFSRQRMMAVLTLLLLLPACKEQSAPREVGAPARDGAPNVVLYVSDTLRASSLKLYDESGIETPELASLALEGALFEQAYAPSSWTRASIGSLLTGLYPDVHGAEGRDDVLAENLVLLSELFARNGYATGAIVTNPNIGATFGFDQGFDDFIELYGREEHELVTQQTAAGRLGTEVQFASSDAVSERAINWIEGARSPFFLFVLAIDPHWPYRPPAEFDRYGGDYSGRVDEDPAAIFRSDLTSADRRRLLSLYHGEIAFNDRSLGRLLDHLRSAKIFDDTIIVFTSDHGEEFWEHGQFMHGRALFQESIRIPLVIRYPKAMSVAARVAEPVELVDVAATLIDLADLSPPYALDGRSLRERHGSAEREIFATLALDHHLLQAITTPPWKLIYDRTTGERALFNLELDQIEVWNLAGRHRNRVTELERRLASRVARNARRREKLVAGSEARRVSQDELSEVERDALKALGYLRDGDDVGAPREMSGTTPGQPVQ